MKQQNGNLNVRIWGNVELKKDKIILTSPIKKGITKIFINGKSSSSFNKDKVYITGPNADITIVYQK